MCTGKWFTSCWPENHRFLSAAGQTGKPDRQVRIFRRFQAQMRSRIAPNDTKCEDFRASRVQFLPRLYKTLAVQTLDYGSLIPTIFPTFV